MVSSCCAVGFTNRQTKDSSKSFHVLPSDPSPRALWLKALKRIGPGNKPWVPSKREVICSDHFKLEDFTSSRNGSLKLLKESAVPSIFSWQMHLKECTRSTTISRKEKTEDAPYEEKGNKEDFAAVNQDHTYATDTNINNLKRKYEECRNRLEKMKKQLNNTKRREKRAKGNLESILQELKENRQLSEEAQQMLDSYKDIPVELFKRAGHQYTVEQKQFATTLYFYGPKAYRFLREKLTLLHEATIRRWLGNISSKPRIAKQVVNMLEEKAQKEPTIYSYCSILVDGMAIRKNLNWDPKSQEMVGFVNLGAGSLDSESPVAEATEAIVVMAVGLTGHWKVLLAYFLVNGISAEVQAQLLLSCISSLYDVKVNVVALVMDGHPVNRKMASILGCSLNPENILSSFPHPSDGILPVYVFFDACHLLKNIRCALHALREVHTSVGTARWIHLVRLQELQECEGLHAANKLTSRHIRFCHNKMKVRLAAQTFSSSVSAALRFASQEGCVGFDDCDGTANFISMIDHLFDIFSSRTPVAKGYKSPLRPEILANIEKFLLETRDVLLTMTDMTGKRVCEGKRKACVIGFAVNIDSLLALTKIYSLWAKSNFKLLTDI